MPTKVQNNYLLGTVIDKTMSKLCSQDFAYKAILDGKVTSIDTKNKLIMLEYSDGSKSAIDISEKSAKNSASGFYVNNYLTPTSKVKVGSKFKKGEILAVNKQFFKEDMDGSSAFSGGRLTKVALMCLSSTYEDSAPITDNVRREMSSEITTEKQVAVKENSLIISVAKVGQSVNVNDPMIIFEEVGDTAQAAIDALDRSMESAVGSDLEHIGRNVIKSKYSGVITDIKVYYNCDLNGDKIHPSLKKYVEGYIKDNKGRSNTLKGMREDEIIETASLDRIMNEKILGNEMSGVLICFFIQHTEDLSIGGKISFFSACKAIISEVIADDEAPTSEYRSENVVEAVLSPMSLIARNVPDLPLLGFSNKVILELKFQCLEELGIK